MCITGLSDAERNRTPVGRPDFKSGEGRQTSLVGSTPTLFRQAKPAIIGPMSEPLILEIFSDYV